MDSCHITDKASTFQYDKEDFEDMVGGTGGNTDVDVPGDSQASVDSASFTTAMDSLPGPSGSRSAAGRSASSFNSRLELPRMPLQKQQPYVPASERSNTSSLTLSHRLRIQTWPVLAYRCLLLGERRQSSHRRQHLHHRAGGDHVLELRLQRKRLLRKQGLQLLRPNVPRHRRQL